MSITLDYNNMMSEFIQHGITQHWLQDFADMARCAHGAVEANRGKGMQEWMLSPYVKSKDIKRILEVAAKARKFRNFVVLGMRLNICTTTSFPTKSGAVRGFTWWTTSIPKE